MHDERGALARARTVDGQVGQRVRGEALDLEIGGLREGQQQLQAAELDDLDLAAGWVRRERGSRRGGGGAANARFTASFASRSATSRCSVGSAD